MATASPPPLPPGSVAVVTGAGGGIGGACAAALAGPGVRIGLLDLDPQRLAGKVHELRAAGAEPLELVVDVTDADAVVDAVDRVSEAYGPVDVAVSTVAHEEHGGFLDVDAHALRRCFDGTVVSGFRFCRAVVDRMIAAGRPGRLVLIGSLHALAPIPGAIAYNLAEAGLAHLAATMAHELAEHRIAVNVVQPGWVDTPGERRWYTDEQLANVGAALPFRRLARPSDIAHAVAFLAAPGSEYVTGSVVRVDGGLAVSMARLPEVDS